MNTKRIENLHVAFWLLKDFSWCSNWRWLGLMAVVPTLVMAGRIAWSKEKEPADVAHNIAVCFWALANVTWMTGEFFFQDTTRGIARVFFSLGLIVLAIYYVSAGTKQFLSRR